MKDQTVALLLSRIRRGLIEIVFHRNTADLWRLPHVDARNELRTSGAIMQWLATATPFTHMAKIAELHDDLEPSRRTHLFTLDDAADPGDGMAWFTLQDRPDLAFMNESRLLDRRTREITELIIAHQNPYKTKPGFR